MDKQTLLRQLPKMDQILESKEVVALRQTYGQAFVVEVAREHLNSVRQNLLAGKEQGVDLAAIVQGVCKEVDRQMMPSLKRVINGTGIVLHTNLGRAVLPQRAVKQALDIAVGYSTLEYDVVEGRRGSRQDHMCNIIAKLCGAEDALVVNNNAAAVLLVLACMSQGKEVVVSRGELVEIGGAFRVPEIMQLSQSKLVEIGTTNKTHEKDYLDAITDETAMLLKVHTSNFKILGFTDEVKLDRLVQLGKETNVPVVYDLGGGALFDLAKMQISDEPLVQDLVKTGVDVLCFSGDKLLGSIQAGIIVGKKQFVSKMKKHPYARAMRVDKMTISLLSETLKCYLDEEVALREVPTLNMLSQTVQTLTPKAKELARTLSRAGVKTSLCKEFGQVGGGSVPTQMLESVCVAIEDSTVSPSKLEEKLRHCSIPVIGRIVKDKFLLDVRTIDSSEFAIVRDALVEVIKPTKKA